MNRFKSAALAAVAMTAICTTQAEGAKQIFWEEYGLIQKMNLDGSGQKVVMEGTKIEGFHADAEEGHIYWWERISKSIFRSDMDGANKVRLYKMADYYEHIYCHDLTVDVEGRRIYWSVRDNRSATGTGIKSINFSGGDEQWLVNDLNLPFGIEIDNGRLFWNDASASTIESISLDGTDRQLIASGATVQKPIGLSLDRENDVLYYCNIQAGQVMKINYDGSGQELVFENSADFWMIDMEYFQGRILISESKTDRLISTDLTGGDVQEITSFFDYPGQISIGSDNRIYVSDPVKQSVTSYDANGENELVNLQCLGLSNVYSMAINDTAGTMTFITGNDLIASIDLEGNSFTRLTDMQPKDITGLTLGNGKIYWSDDDSLVYRSDIDGKNIEALPAYMEDVEVLFVDEVGEYLYYSEGRKEIFRTDLDCSTAPELLFATDGWVEGIFVYPEIGRIIYTEQSMSQLVSRNLDGSDKLVLATADYGFGAVDVDKETDIVYWVADSSVHSVNLDGTDSKVLYTSAEHNFEYLALGTVPDETGIEKAFSFSDPSLWNINAGTLESNSNSTDDNSSLSVVPQSGYGKVTSVALKTTEITDPSETLIVDMWIDSDQPNAWWTGSLQMVLEIPSADIWYANAGVVQLTPLAKDEWVSVSYTLPKNVLDAMNGDFSDLKISFIYTIQSGSAPYLLDNMRFE